MGFGSSHTQAFTAFNMLHTVAEAEIEKRKHSAEWADGVQLSIPKPLRVFQRTDMFPYAGPYVIVGKVHRAHTALTNLIQPSPLTNLGKICNLCLGHMN